MMDDYKIECIKRCAESNGPCWECKMRGWCDLWEDEKDGRTPDEVGR